MIHLIFNLIYLFVFEAFPDIVRVNVPESAVDREEGGGVAEVAGEVTSGVGALILLLPSANG